MQTFTSMKHYCSTIVVLLLTIKSALVPIKDKDSRLISIHAWMNLERQSMAIYLILINITVLQQMSDRYENIYYFSFIIEKVIKYRSWTKNWFWTKF